MNLDIRTVVYLAALSAFTMSALLLLTAKSYPGKRDGLWPWAVACASQSLGLLLFALRGTVSDLLSIVVANVLVAMAAVLYYRAVTEFNGRRFRGAGLYTLVAFTALAFLHFTYADPQPLARLTIISAITAFIALAAARMLLWVDGRKPFSHWVTGLFFAVAGFIIAGRAIFFLLSGTPLNDVFIRNTAQDVAFIGNFVGIVIGTFGFILMRSDRFSAELIRLATLDSLTESFNRSTMERMIRAEMSRARRERLPMCLLLLDLDLFKQVNDTYGHVAGDAVLKEVAGAIRAHLRISDTFGRYGGEEFVVLLPNTAPPAAEMVAERLRAAIEGLEIREGKRLLSTTTSIGIASYEGGTFASLVDAADSAMYEAKARGRNCVAIAPPERASA